ncbi:transporter [Oleiphilus sp. HI0071]|nr:MULTISPECIES: SLC13 family permease [unclassified Oleiphilus]KZY64629.1 transporter [Oleiphilus sp. HI0065]KZY88851.1 transporter [Oleiphilus sp. HI0071]KZY89917.1 transporter [Oleiphilus sp. HI0073]KZZ50089.1 transporter [Oleiphilus sp. HI0122]KZZ78047.1 transporter [Oleiphilus sp. HI0133]
MSWQMLAVCLLFFSVIGCLVFRIASVARIFGVALCALYGFGFVSTNDVLASASNSGVVSLVLLMLCSLAIEKTSYIRLLGVRLIKPGLLSTRLRLMFTTVLSSAFLNNTAVVSALIAPIKNNPHHAPSRLLIFLSYFSILGGTLTLVGTSTNMIINSMLINSGLPALGFFDFTLVGLALVCACGVVLLVIRPEFKELPQESGMASHYLMDAQADMGSPLIGKSIESNGLRNLEGLFLVELVRDGRLISPVSPDEVIEERDHLIFNGDVGKLEQLLKMNGLSLFANKQPSSVQNVMGSNLSEVLIRPDSHLVGKSLKSSGFRAKFDAAVVAIKRDGEAVSGKLGEIELKAGDFLVLAVGADFHSRNNLSNNFVFVSGVEPDHILSDAQGRLAIGGFVAVIALAASGMVELLQGLVLLFALYLLTGCLNRQEVLRRLPVQLWLIITTALLFSKALMSSGVFTLIAHQASEVLMSMPLWAIILSVYVVTWFLTELVTNNAAAALMFPFALGLAGAMNADPMVLVMTVTFAASASFVSPYGYQTNLIVMNAGGYRLQDFVKTGWPVAVVYGLVVVSLVPLVY